MSEFTADDPAAEPTLVDPTQPTDPSTDPVVVPTDPTPVIDPPPTPAPEPTVVNFGTLKAAVDADNAAISDDQATITAANTTVATATAKLNDDQAKLATDLQAFGDAIKARRAFEPNPDGTVTVYEVNGSGTVMANLAYPMSTPITATT